MCGRWIHSIADGYVAVFTEDAVIDSNGSISKGHEEIRKIVTSLIQRRDDNKAKGLPTSNLYHVISNVRITFPKPGEAVHQSYWQTVRRDKRRQDDRGRDGPLRRPTRQAQWQVVDSVAQADRLHRLRAVALRRPQGMLRTALACRNCRPPVLRQRGPRHSVGRCTGVAGAGHGQEGHRVLCWRRIWDRARSREFNVGIRAGLQPNAFEFRLKRRTIEAMTGVRGALVVTVYAPDLTVVSVSRLRRMRGGSNP